LGQQESFDDLKLAIANLPVLPVAAFLASLCIYASMAGCAVLLRDFSRDWGVTKNYDKTHMYCMYMYYSLFLSSLQFTQLTTYMLVIYVV
jgi:hypothetical protein